MKKPPKKEIRTVKAIMPKEVYDYYLERKRLTELKEGRLLTDSQFIDKLLSEDYFYSLREEI